MSEFKWIVRELACYRLGNPYVTLCFAGVWSYFKGLIYTYECTCLSMRDVFIYDWYLALSITQGCVHAAGADSKFAIPVPYHSSKKKN